MKEYRLGRNGCCQRTDLAIDGQRLYLDNLRLDAGFFHYRQQVRALFDLELLGHPSFHVSVANGDFADPLAAALSFAWPASLRRTLPLLERHLSGPKPAAWSGSRLYAGWAADP
ncbi:MAG: hypothetical protein R2864_14370 [Syntrophotaleaceae bacterium]